MEDCQLWLRPRIERYSLASSGCSACTIRPTGPMVLELPNMGNHNVKLMASLSRRITTKTFRVLEKTMPYLIENYTPFIKQLQECHLVLEETDQLPIEYQMSMFSKLSIMIWVLQTHEVMRLGGSTAIHHKTRHRQLSHIQFSGSESWVIHLYCNCAFNCSHQWCCGCDQLQKEDKRLAWFIDVAEYFIYW